MPELRGLDIAHELLELLKREEANKSAIQQCAIWRSDMDAEALPTQVALLDHRLSTLESWRKHFEQTLSGLDTARIQAESAASVVQTQGRTQQRLAWMQLVQAVGVATITALLMWWLTGSPKPPGGP